MQSSHVRYRSNQFPIKRLIQYNITMIYFSPEPKGYLDTPCLPSGTCIQEYTTCDSGRDLCVCGEGYYKKGKECSKSDYSDCFCHYSFVYLQFCAINEQAKRIDSSFSPTKTIKISELLHLLNNKYIHQGRKSP